MRPLLHCYRLAICSATGSEGKKWLLGGVRSSPSPFAEQLLSLTTLPMRWHVQQIGGDLLACPEDLYE